MKKLILVSSIFAMAALSSQSALAEIKVRGGVANTSLLLGYIGVYNNADITNTFLTTSLGLTYISEGGMYLDVSGAEGSAPGKVSRSDAAMYVGTSGVNDSGRGYNYYIGYKTGKTVLTEPVLTSSNQDIYETSGVIVGGGLNWPLDMGGAVGVNLAVGLGMNATWKDDVSYSATATGANGFSVGASYTYPFSPAYGINVDMKSNVYTYEYDSCKNAAFQCQYKEHSRSLTANLYYQF